MSSAPGVNKLTAERNQRILLELVSQPSNNVCADCKARNPRWASFNLGIFICVGCASVHRKIGTHISKVKSVTLDSWSKEQVDRMKEMGNLKSNAIYNPNEVRHPPPTVLDDPTRDNDLEQHIRSKYEYRRFMDKHALAASRLGPSRSASSVVPRINPAPPTQPVVKPTPPAPKPTTATDIAANMFSTNKPQIHPRATPSQVSVATPSPPSTRSVSQPVVSKNVPQIAPPAAKPEGVWADLISLQEPSSNSSLPLQYQTSSHVNIPLGFSNAGVNPFSNLTGIPTGNPTFNPFSQQPFSANALNQQTSFSTQSPMPSFQTPMSAPPFQAAASQLPMGLSQPNTFQNQFQPQSSPIPFYQPQPQTSTLSPTQLQPQFLSPSPNTQFLSSHSPQPQSTTPSQPHQNSGFNGSMVMGGVGHMTPSPQPMVNGMPGQIQLQGPTFGMQPNGTFGSAFVQTQPPMMMNNPFGQPQFTRGGFPGQAGTQWGPL